MPDGNLYKMEGGTGELNNQGPTQPTNKADLNAFKGAYEGGNPSEAWWEENLDLEDYYGFRAMSMAIHDYDMHAGKNYFFYHDPEMDWWRVFNWDLDLTWTTTYGGGGGRGPLNEHVLNPNPRFQLEYRNRVRELRDLLFNSEQTGIMLDEVAGMVHTPGEISWVDADRAMWDYNPILVSSYINSSKAGHGRFYESASGRTFAGMLDKQHAYVSSRGAWMDTNEARDSAIPRRPTVTSIGPGGFPVDALTFQTSDFSDPQGAGSFGAMKWRVAEISPPGAPDFDPAGPKLHEIDAVWESEELASFESDVTVPAGVLRIGHLYRVRVRMMDTTGRWSNWSAPIEFTPGEPTAPFPQQDSLRITEIMYHPPEGQDYEFIELQNVGGAPVDLRPVSFIDGIGFDFASSDVTQLNPGEFVVVVENEAVFRSRYDAGDVTIAGEYSGRLGNGSERLVLNTGGNSTILDFEYLDDWYPLTDGGGHSLVIIDAEAPASSWANPASWVESNEIGGSPGYADGDPPVGGLQLVGDSNQDGDLNIADAVSLLLHLFGGGPEALPCEGDQVDEGGNLVLLDVNADAGVDLSDAVFLLQYMFANGPSPVAGTSCIRIEGCPTACTW